MKKILLIDDDDSIRQTYSKILEKSGFTVTALNDGIHVSKALKKEAFDLIITDIVMPQKEGLETISDIRKVNKSIPILAISGGGRISPENHLYLARTLGANASLTKPFDKVKLVEKVNELLEKV